MIIFVEFSPNQKMKKNSRHSGAYTSPATPDNNVGEIPKSWSSERVPLPTNRRHVSAAAALMSGRALPSKWDDAERWITSPVSSYGSVKNAIPQPQRRAKSKSGPLGPPGVVYLGGCSPNGPGTEGANTRNFMANSALTTGVLVADGLSIHYEGGKSGSLHCESSINRSSSVPGLSDLVGEEASVLSSQDDKLNGSTIEEEAVESRGINHRDMATQMSPEGSTHSSSKGRLSFSNLPASLRQNSNRNSSTAVKDEVRDVQVDKGTPTARHSKRHVLKKTKKDSTNVGDVPLPWNASESSKNTSRVQREEAKITAWENLQKAKAEAAIRKLEMKLEKRRSTSMDKIMNKLKDSQTKAQAMRNLLSENHTPSARKTSHMGFSGCINAKQNVQSNCFLCCKK